MPGDRAGYDQNYQATLLAVSTADGFTPVVLEADPTTHALVVQATISTAGLATASNQTSGAQKSQIVDGSGNVVGATANALDINIKSGNPTTIAVTQATAASLNATVVGTGTFAVQAAQSGSWTVSAASATGAAIPANAFFIGLTDGTNLIGTKAVSHGMNTVTGIIASGLVAEFDDTSPTTVSENQFGPLRMSTNRNLYGTIRDAAGNERGVNVTAANELIVGGSGSAGTSSTAVVTVQGISGMNGLKVIGNTGSGSAISAAPVTVGGQAKTANPTAVTDGQVVNATYDKLGKQVVVGSIRDLKADAALTLTASTTETTLIAAIAATFNDLYGLIVTNISATACEVIFRDVAAGTARFSIHVPAGDTRGFMLPESAAYKQATVNTAWTAQCVTSVSSIKINALYVKNI